MYRQVKSARKANIVVFGTMLIMMFVIGFILVGGIIFAVEHAVDMWAEVSVAEQTCLDNGYPNIQINRSKYYCVRQLNGTDEVVPLSDFMGE